MQILALAGIMMVNVIILSNTSTNPSEKTSNKLPLPGHDRAYRRLSRS